MGINNTQPGCEIAGSPEAPATLPLLLNYQPSASRSVSILDLTTDLLSQGLRVSFRASGSSMKPFIMDGEVITVAPVAASSIRRGDIILYCFKQTIIAHSVVRIKRGENKEPLFILRGDLSCSGDEPVRPQQVLGRVVSVERNRRSIDLNSTRARMQRIAYTWAFRCKRRLLHIF